MHPFFALCAIDGDDDASQSSRASSTHHHTSLTPFLPLCAVDGDDDASQSSTASSYSTDTNFSTYSHHSAPSIHYHTPDSTRRAADLCNGMEGLTLHMPAATSLDYAGHNENSYAGSPLRGASSAYGEHSIEEQAAQLECLAQALRDMRRQGSGQTHSTSSSPHSRCERTKSNPLSPLGSHTASGNMRGCLDDCSNSPDGQWGGRSGRNSPLSAPLTRHASEKLPTQRSSSSEAPFRPPVSSRASIACHACKLSEVVYLPRGSACPGDFDLSFAACFFCRLLAVLARLFLVPLR